MGCRDRNPKEEFICRYLELAHGFTGVETGSKGENGWAAFMYHGQHHAKDLNATAWALERNDLVPEPLVLCRILLGLHSLPQRVKTHTSALQALCSLNRGSALSPDVILAMQGLNKQQQMGSPLLLCTAKLEDDSKTRFAELLLTAGWFERAVNYSPRK